jgi:hypothetical protein
MDGRVVAATQVSALQKDAWGLVQQMHTSQRSVFGRLQLPFRSEPWGSLSLQRAPSPGSLPGHTFAQPSPPHHAPQTTPASHDTVSVITGQEDVQWLLSLSSSFLRKHC